ncbi:MAG: hypothetical protein R2851_14135 [Caldilineaceae bacterium]
MPELHNFAVVPDVFRPNQDGLRDDWVSISYYLTKDVDEVLVYLIDRPSRTCATSFPKSQAWPSEERGYHEYRRRGRRPERGAAARRHVRHRGRGARPLRQRRAATRELTIAEGGKPCRRGSG